jgi:hypothetical protein
LIKERAPGILMLGALIAAAAPAPLQTSSAIRELRWEDVRLPVQQLLGQHGVDGTSFQTHISKTRQHNQMRVREGDLDHLIYYALQSSTFTDLPPIEPAISSVAFTRTGSIPTDARARLSAFAAADVHAGAETRLGYFRETLRKERPDGMPTDKFLAEQYIRAMRILYEKEFVAARGPGRIEAVGKVYQARGLSTDTSVEAGYIIHLVLATLRELEPQRRIRTVLIVGPGLDIAPRTGFLDASHVQSYQPFAVMDALLMHGLAGRDELRATAADINPRVVSWFVRPRDRSVLLKLTTSVAENDRVRFTDDFRAYFEGIGRGLAGVGPASPKTSAERGPLMKSLEIDARVLYAVDAQTIDVVVDRLESRYDLIVVTNVFPYLSDADLLLGLTNLAAMLAPSGILLHNEPRPVLAEATSALRLALLHSRSAVIATVAGAESPLYDSVWMHRAPE